MKLIEKISLSTFSSLLLGASVLFFIFELNPLLSLVLSVVILGRLILMIHKIEKEKEAIQNQLISHKNRELLQKKSLTEKDQALQNKYFIDDISKLPNRNALLETSKIEEPYTLVLINIDSFKEINDFYGHIAGDSLIKQLSTVLTNMPLLYEHTLYHVHVDEFAFLIHKKISDKAIKELVKGIEKFTLKHTFYASMNQSILFTLSFGISSSKEGDTPNKSLCMEANIALSHARTHTETWAIFDDTLKEENHYEENLYWLKKLKSAIEEDRIEPFYQPIVNHKTNKIISQEALIRIIGKNAVPISPYLFLGVAKKAKLYTTLTKIMIEKTFTNFSKSNMSFSINFSYEDMVDKEVLALLSQKLQQGNIGRRFTAEILESESITNYDLAKNFIDTIKAYGSKVAIDDFGSGYSNFERLFKLDIDYVKIDGSIIKDIDENEQLRIITETIVDFAHKTNINVVAEYVHSQEIVNILEKMGVTQMQGFYFAEPSSEIITELKDEKQLMPA